MKLYQITEEDLAELERVLPQVFDRLMIGMDNRIRVQFRSVQKIITNVRWNYGPWSNAEQIPADGIEPMEPPGSPVP
jgi:hypothetical protein